jgi:hypothetical protein
MTKSKSVEPPKLATSLLERFLPDSGPLTGDLIEAFKHGRSSGWYRRQAFVAILIALPHLMRKYLALFAYAVACSAVISTAWFFMFPSAVRESAFPRLFGLYAKGYGIDWPWSFVYQIAFITAFQAATVWAALIAYLKVSRQLRRRNLLRALLVVLVVLAISNVALPLVSGLLSSFQWFGWVVVSAPAGIALIVAGKRRDRAAE